ncbi:anti-sigma factor domain-containing protein [Glutamicibacter endophyticus]|uniref:anti-sigma factor n=1 Tax=Glutamicibacter endophyticus TaxID=1522174 RepID=UPI003AF070A2
MEQRKNSEHADAAAAYALNAMSNTERADFERLLATDEALAQDVQQLSEGAAVLGYAATEQPPAQLKRNVLDAIRDLPQQPAADPTSATSAAQEPASGPEAAMTSAPTPGPVREERVATEPVPRARRGRTAFALAAATLLVAALGLGGILVAEHRQGNELREQLNAAQNEAQGLRSLLQAPDLRTVQARTSDGATVTLAYSSASGLMSVSGEQLPKAPEGHGYELWLIGDSGATPAGMLASGEVSLVEGSMEGVTHLGITVEPAGGSPQPTTDPILVQEL